MNKSVVTDYQTDEAKLEMGSLNHSLAQARLTALLSHYDNFTTLVELSLDTSQIDLNLFHLRAKDELKPDICLYPGHLGYSEESDILKMSEMPWLAIEVISPKQGFEDILSKFRAYFALGVKSCWLIMPAIKSIAVYSLPTWFKTFSMKDDEVIDDVLEIHLPLQKIFG